MNHVQNTMASLMESGIFVPTTVEAEPATQDPSLSAPSALLAMHSLDSTQTAIPPPKPQPKQGRRRKAASRRPRPTTVAPRSSVMRGVTRHTRTGRFDAHIWCDGRQWYLGAFTSELLAGAAYDVAAIKMRPHELPLNLPIDRYQGRLGQLLDMLTVEEVLEATRHASKKRDVFVRPDAEEFGNDAQAMLALLLQAFEAVAAANDNTAPLPKQEVQLIPPLEAAPKQDHPGHFIPPPRPSAPPLPLEHPAMEPWNNDELRAVQDLLESAHPQQPCKRPKAEGLWVATGPPRGAVEAGTDAVLFPALCTPTVGVTPTFGAFSPLGGMTPTALLAEGLWGAADCWAFQSVEHAQGRLPGAAEADDELLLLYGQSGTVPGWE